MGNNKSLPEKVYAAVERNDIMGFQVRELQTFCRCRCRGPAWLHRRFGAVFAAPDNASRFLCKCLPPGGCSACCVRSDGHIPDICNIGKVDSSLIRMHQRRTRKLKYNHKLFGMEVPDQAHDPGHVLPFVAPQVRTNVRVGPGPLQPE